MKRAFGLIQASCIGVACVGLALAPAQAGDVYAVEDIPVSADATSSAQARVQALDAGHREALARLLKRLTLPVDWARLPKIRAREARSLARSFEPSGEKTGRGRYVASLTVRFTPERIRALLYEEGIPFSDIQARPALLVPLYEDAKGNLFLWKEPNPWRKAFAAIDFENLPTPFILPIGDISDISTLSPSAAREQDRRALIALGAAYRAVHILLLHARADARGNLLEVKAAHILSGGDDKHFHFTITADAADALIPRARDAFLETVTAAWKRRTQIASDAEGQQRIRVRFSSFAEWQRLREHLARSNLVRTQKLLSLSRREAHLSITYIGSPAILALALSQDDIVLAYESKSGAVKSLPWTMNLRP